MLDELDFEIRVAACENVRAARRDRITTRVLYIAPAMAKILVDEFLDLNDRLACRQALGRYFTPDDVYDLLDAALAEARDMLSVRKGTVQ